MLVAVIDMFCNKRKRICYAANSTLADWMGVTTRHIRRMLAKLIKNGFVVQGEEVQTRWGPKKPIWPVFRRPPDIPVLPPRTFRSYPPGHSGPTSKYIQAKQSIEEREAVAADAADRDPGELVNTKQESAVPPLRPILASALSKPSQTKTTPTPFDHESADFVRLLCVEQQWVVARTHKKWWADQVRKLRQSENGPTSQQIADTLAAYAAAVKAGKTKFKITDCHQLRTHWHTVESIAQKMPPPASPSAVEIARKVSLQAKWPKVTPADVAGFAQRCISFGEDLCRRLSAVKKKLEDKKPKTTADRVLIGAAQALHVRVANPDSWTMTYMAKVLKEVRAWKDWSGDLSMYLPSLTSGKAGLRKAVLAAGCDEPTWTLLKEALK